MVFLCYTLSEMLSSMPNACRCACLTYADSESQMRGVHAEPTLCSSHLSLAAHSAGTVSAAAVPRPSKTGWQGRYDKVQPT